MHLSQTIAQFWREAALAQHLNGNDNAGGSSSDVSCTSDVTVSAPWLQQMRAGLAGAVPPVRGDVDMRELALNCSRPPPPISLWNPPRSGPREVSTAWQGPQSATPTLSVSKRST